MTPLRVLLQRLLAPLTRRRWDADLDDELRAHLDLEVDHLVSAGTRPDEARRLARRQLGGVERTRQAYRDQKGLPMLDMLIQDVRFAVRLLVKERAFTLVAVATLALAIGANTAIFSVVNGVLLEPLPFQHSDRIVTVWEDFSAQGGPEQEWIEVPNFVEWKAETDVFDTLAAYGFGTVNLTGRGEPQLLTQGVVSYDFFDTFSVAPALGRGFAIADDQPGAEAVALVSDGFWQRVLGGDAAALGDTLDLNGEPVTVVGVLPEDFSIPLTPPVDVWMPVRVDPVAAGRNNFFLRALGRLADGVTVDQATERLDAIMLRIGDTYPENRGVTITIIPLLDLIVSPVRSGLYLLLGVVAFILLIACANIANLMLSRGASRTREIAVRTAVGAGRGRIVRQLLTESLVLSTCGAIVGVALAHWGTRVLVAQAPAGSAPRLDNIGLDGSVLMFTVVVTLVAGLAFGLAPVAQARRHDVNGALKEGGRDQQEAGFGARLRSGLVVAQVALALCLLISAGLTIRSFVALMDVDPGFAPEGLTTATVRMPPEFAAGPDELVAFMDQLLERTGGHDGIESVAAVSVLPFSGGDSDTGFSIEGRPDLDAPGRQPIAWFRRVSAGYFETMGLSIVDGRAFTRDDRAGGEPVVMVSEVTAERFWPGERVVGKRIRFGPDSPWNTVVGVTAGVRHQGLAAAPRPELYFPFAQRPGRVMTLVVRSAAGEGAVADMLRADLSELGPTLPLSTVASMESLVATSAAQPRFFMNLTAAFGLLALVLSAVGIYGVMAYSVARRTNEMGLRMALGASRAAVMSMVVWHGLTLTALGLALGLVIAFWSTALMASVLFDVTPRDLPTFVGAAVLLTLVAVAASAVPALRATRIDPISALRQS